MMKVLLFILIFVPTIAFANPDSVSQKVPITIWVSPDKNFPMKAVVYDKTVYLLTFDQVKILSLHASRSETSEKLIKAIKTADSINRLRIYELNEKIVLLTNSLHAAEMKHQLEKQKSANKDVAIEKKDELLEEKDKEIKKQKGLKIITIIVSGAIVVLSLLI